MSHIGMDWAKLHSDLTQTHSTTRKGSLGASMNHEIHRSFPRWKSTFRCEEESEKAGRLHYTFVKILLSWVRDFIAWSFGKPKNEENFFLFSFPMKFLFNTNVENKNNILLFYVPSLKFSSFFHLECLSTLYPEEIVFIKWWNRLSLMCSIRPALSRLAFYELDLGWIRAWLQLTCIKGSKVV